jgi:hypothetical protein
VNTKDKTFDIENSMVRDISREIDLKTFGQMNYYTFGKLRKKRRVDPSLRKCFGRIYDKKVIKAQLKGEDYGR